MGYSNPDELVSTDWLEANLDNPNIRTIEVDEDVSAYGRGHIPGAVAWNWSTDLQHPVRRDYLDSDGLAALLSQAGVGGGTTVILYGGNNNWFAAYAYWLLRYRGFDAVKLLNGGRLKWNIEARPKTTEVPTYEPTDLTIDSEDRPELRAFRNEVLGRLGDATYVDVRSPEEFTGEKLAPDHLPQEQPYVGGHVPGARNIPWIKAAQEDGSFRSRDELEALYHGEGVAPGADVIAYCRIGERSAHTWFVLTQLLGYQGVKNYDGSWTEYGSLVGVPVEVGSS
jgi:thiosulfate/3-mercaptopyruvate sulfurtransferase